MEIQEFLGLEVMYLQVERKPPKKIMRKKKMGIKKVRKRKKEIVL